MAPGAKVTFYDIQGTNSYLSIPSNLANNMFKSQRNAGARVLSNSWGGGNYYNSYCYDTDYFTYNNPDVLILFAAGNYGV